MQTRKFPRTSYGDVEVDLCTDCRVFWFDKGESTQLSASAVIVLFREIHGLSAADRRPMSSVPGCPRCGTHLVLAHDIVKSGRLTYYRCPNDHGRLTPFYQFLREKRFVRDLGAGELAELRARIRQVSCSNCGAPIDLERSSCCEYCQSPVAILDQDAVEKALREWGTQATAEAAGPDPAKLADAMVLAEKYKTAAQPVVRWNEAMWRVENGTDLVEACIDLTSVAIAELFGGV